MGNLLILRVASFLASMGTTVECSATNRTAHKRSPEPSFGEVLTLGYRRNCRVIAVIVGFKFIPALVARYYLSLTATVTK